jgi:type III secretory pathway component EscV
MKRTFLLFSAVIVLGLLVSCSESKNSTKGEETATIEQAVEAQPAEAAREAKELNASERVASQFEQLGIELSSEQEQQIENIASRYDFQGAADRDSRREMRQNFQKEVFENVLDQNQRDIFNQKRGAERERR